MFYSAPRRLRLHKHVPEFPSQGDPIPASGDLGVALVGRCTLYWSTNRHLQRATVRRISAPYASYFPHVVAYPAYRQPSESALRGLVDTLLDAAFCA